MALYFPFVKDGWEGRYYYLSSSFYFSGAESLEHYHHHNQHNNYLSRSLHSCLRPHHLRLELTMPSHSSNHHHHQRSYLFLTTVTKRKKKGQSCYRTVLGAQTQTHTSRREGLSGPGVAHHPKGDNT